MIPALGAKRLGTLTKPDIHEMLDAIVERGSPIVANCVLAVFRRLCNWSVGRGYIPASPCEAIELPSAEKSRDRVLSDNEIRLAWQAFELIGWPFGPIAKLLLLTGARRDEIAGARRSEVNIEARTWTIAKERSKNGVAHEIPLSDAAIDILKSMPRIGKGDGFIFTTNGKTAVSGFSKAKALIDAKMAALAGAEVAPWVLHDLRRTAASGMAGIGIPPHVVEAVLNHKSGTIKGVAAVYNHYNYAAEKRQALNSWAHRLDAIVTGVAASNVVELASARG